MAVHPRTIESLPLVHQGKTRELCGIPGRPDTLLMTASDRLSTHNIVHESMVPAKGQILTALTVFWLTQVLYDLPHHLVAYGDDIYAYLPAGQYPDDLHLRAIVVRKLDMIPVEFVRRFYLTGSLWNAYQRGEQPYGLALPPDLELRHCFGESGISTPTAKSGSDEALDAAEVCEQHPMAESTTMVAAQRARTHLLDRGLELLDTKLEMGIESTDADISVCPSLHFLADEVFTPDSSRIVSAYEVVTGQHSSYDCKEFFRQEAEQIAGGKPDRPLTFPASTIQTGALKYAKLFEQITGLPLPDFQRTFLAAAR